MSDENKNPEEEKTAGKMPAPPSPAPPPAPVAPKPPPPAKKPTGPQLEEISADPLIEALKGEFGGAILSAKKFLGQRILEVETAQLIDVLAYLRDDPEADFKLLSDVTAVDYPKKPKRFEVVYQLYSIRKNHELRIKTSVASGQSCPSVVPLWSTANWLERECYDMFGIEFDGHPDLRRILLPDGWHGFPLRKEYEIRQQDEEWIRANLTIRKNIYS